MMKLALRLFFAIVLFLTTMGPFVDAILANSDACDDCICDQLPETERDEKQIPCPPQCGSCFCFVSSAVLIQQPNALFSPPTYDILEEFFDASPPLTEETPPPPFQPPKA